MNNRPRIQPSLTVFDKRIEQLSLLFLLLLLGLSVYVYIKTPDIIPVHFGISGKPDNYGSKWVLIILPVLGIGSYLLLTTLNRYPHVFNYPGLITEQNAEKQYAMATRMLRCIKLTVLVLLTMIVLFTYLTTLGVVKGIGVWFIPVFGVLMFAPVVIFIMRSFKEKN
jgi:uncharacterized membrane protein